MMRKCSLYVVHYTLVYQSVHISITVPLRVVVHLGGIVSGASSLLIDMVSFAGAEGAIDELGTSLFDLKRSVRIST